MPLPNELSQAITDRINEIRTYCGEDTILAEKALDAIRAGFTLPSLGVIPEGVVRDTIKKLLCNVAGLDIHCPLPDGNQVRRPIKAAPRLGLLERLRRRFAREQAEVRLRLIVQAHEDPLVIDNVANEAKRLLTAELKHVDEINRAKDHIGILTMGTDEHQFVREYVLSARIADLYDRSTQSAFEFSAKASTSALIISSLSSMATFFLALAFWEASVPAVLAVLFASCAYILSDLIVFYWNDARYKKLLGKGESIFAERRNAIDVVSDVFLYATTAVSVHVSPFLALTKITVPGLNMIAFLGACISPFGSNSSIMERSFFAPLKALFHMLQYCRNPEDYKNLRKRMELVLILQKAIDIYKRMSNDERDDIARRLHVMESPDTKTGIGTARLCFLAEMVHTYREKISWYSKQSWITRKGLDLSIWSVAVFLGLWAGIYYRETGKNAVCGWEHMNEAYMTPSWKCQNEYDTWYGWLGGYGSFFANSWYYVAANYLVVSFISMLIAERPNYQRLFTLERISFINLFALISVAPTVAAVQLANNYTDPLYRWFISVPNLVSMNVLSLYNFKDELVAKWWSHNHRFLQRPGLSKMHSNHIANRQLFTFERLVGEMIRLLETSDIAVAADLFELIRSEQARLHPADNIDDVVRMEAGLGDGLEGLAVLDTDNALEKPHTLSGRRSKRQSMRPAQSAMDMTLPRLAELDERVQTKPVAKPVKKVQPNVTSATNHAPAATSTAAATTAATSTSTTTATSPTTLPAVRERRERVNTWSSSSSREISNSPESENGKPTLVVREGDRVARSRAWSFASVTERRPTLFREVRRDLVYGPNMHCQLPNIAKMAEIVARDDDAAVRKLTKAGLLKQDGDHYDLHPNRFEFS